MYEHYGADSFHGLHITGNLQGTNELLKNKDDKTIKEIGITDFLIFELIECLFVFVEQLGVLT